MNRFFIMVLKIIIQVILEKKILFTEKIYFFSGIGIWKAGVIKNEWME